jgi:hypothetical protein
VVLAPPSKARKELGQRTELGQVKSAKGGPAPTRKDEGFLHEYKSARECQSYRMNRQEPRIRQ